MHCHGVLMRRAQLLPLGCCVLPHNSTDTLTVCQRKILFPESIVSSCLDRMLAQGGVWGGGAQWDGNRGGRTGLGLTSSGSNLKDDADAVIYISRFILLGFFGNV